MRQRFKLSISVFVIVRRGESVLLLRRAGTGWMDGYYSLPAGAHDGNETLISAAARELKEETGLVVRQSDLRLVHLLHCAAGDTGDEWLGAFFVADTWSGEPQVIEQGKHDHIGWYALSALPANLVPYTRQGIELSMKAQAFSAYGWKAS